MITLRFPNINDIPQIEKTCNADWALDFGFVHYWESKLNREPSALIDFLPKLDIGEDIPEGHIACCFMFAFNEKNEIVGRTSIRKVLVPHLRTDGGHIGYAVVPEFRKQGIATEILKQSLDYCRENNINEDGKVLVTCDDDNLGSIKTITGNGGILQDKIELAHNKPLKRRYWIAL